MLARSLAAFLTVFAVADAGYIHRGPELPEGYTEGSIVWTGFEHLLKNSGANHPADIKALEGASFNGTIEVCNPIFRMTYICSCNPIFDSLT